jgi:hypothetical protein
MISTKRNLVAVVRTGSSVMQEMFQFHVPSHDSHQLEHTLSYFKKLPDQGCSGNVIFRILGAVLYSPPIALITKQSEPSFLGGATAVTNQRITISFRSFQIPKSHIRKLKYSFFRLWELSNWRTTILGMKAVSANAVLQLKEHLKGSNAQRKRRTKPKPFLTAPVFWTVLTETTIRLSNWRNTSFYLAISQLHSSRNIVWERWYICDLFHVGDGISDLMTGE